MTQTTRQKAMELLKPPFRLNHGYIFDSAHNPNMVADEGECEIGTIARLRGWGRLGYLDDGAKIQDEIGNIICDALNEYFEKHGV